MIRIPTFRALVALSSLLIWCSSMSIAQEAVQASTGVGVSQREYPAFTWDRIPLYMHIRKAKAYTEEEIAFLAKFPLITFEKSNGHQDHGSVEEGTLIAARARPVDDRGLSSEAWLHDRRDWQMAPWIQQGLEQATDHRAAGTGL